jgi:RNase P subunit RPR2
LRVARTDAPTPPYDRTVTEFSRATPAWARSLVATVCAEADTPPPTRLRWASRRRESSSGVTRRHEGGISIVAGTDPLDQRLTVLHELAHWLTPMQRRRGRHVHHDRRFYRTAFALYLANGLAAEDAVRREAGRYPSSLRHAVALAIPGAEAAWRQRRLQLRGRPRSTMRVLVPEHRIRLVRDGRWTVCAVCRQRIVGPNLARLRRRGGRHTLLTRELDTRDLAS